MARKRRGRGEGGIFQRADGLWAATLSLGYDGRGKRRRRTVYGHTKKEVQDKLDDLRLRAPGPGDRQTVGQFLTRWLETTVKTANLRDTTRDRYKAVVDGLLIPAIGGVRLEKLTVVEVEDMFVKLERDGVSARMRQMAGTVLGTALKSAVKKKLIPGNVYREADKPKVERQEMKVWTPEQARLFLEANRDHRLWGLYVLALATGMREGELFGLQWPDINFTTGTLSVQRQLCELRGKLWLAPPKSKSGRRHIVLPGFALDALLDHRKLMLTEGRDVRTGQVFCDTEGNFIRRSNFLRRAFVPAINRANTHAKKAAEEANVEPLVLPRIRFHDLRHTTATLLLMLGAQPKVVAERLGHADPGLVNRTYGHVLPSMQQEATDKLNKLLG